MPRNRQASTKSQLTRNLLRFVCIKSCGKENILQILYSKHYTAYYKLTATMNMADVREANINVVGNWRMPVLGDLNERAILLEKVRGPVNEMKSGNGPGQDGFPVECLKKIGMAVLEWLVRKLNVRFDVGVVPVESRGVCRDVHASE